MGPAPILFVVMLLGLLAGVAAWAMRVRQAAVETGEPMRELRLFRGTRGKLVTVVPTALLLIGLLLVYDLPIAFLLPVSIPLWAPFLSDRDDFSPAARRRLNWALLAVGVLFLATATLAVVVLVAK